MRIDPHVHFRDEEQSYKETIAHGLKTAKEQGVDIVFDMPNTFRPVIDEQRVKERLALVPKGEEKRYYTYLGVTKEVDQLKKAVEIVKTNERVCGLKMFAGKSIGTMEIIEEEEQKKVYLTLAEAGYTGVLAVHCEKESLMKGNFDCKEPFTHCIVRPESAEIESVRDQINFATGANFKGTLHICHVSCKETIELINEAKRIGKIKVTCGVTPHHLLWDCEKMKEPLGLLYKMNPPLRPEYDMMGLRESLKKGEIDFIETDHAPHTIGEKLHAGFLSGYPSLYLYKNLVEEFLPSLGLSKEEIEALTFGNIVKIFKLKL
ncbi:MAG: dihydroorotase [archaeon]|jgi:dihydroorotase